MPPHHRLSDLFRVRFIMTLYVCLPTPGRTEAHITVRALEWLCAGVQSHVYFKTAFGREGIATDVTAKQLLTCKDTKRQTQ